MENNRGGNHKNGYMTAMEFLLKRGIWLRRELHFEAVSKLMEQYAEQKCEESDLESEKLRMVWVDLYNRSQQEILEFAEWIDTTPYIKMKTGEWKTFFKDTPTLTTKEMYALFIETKKEGEAS